MAVISSRSRHLARSISLTASRSRHPSDQDRVSHSISLAASCLTRGISLTATVLAASHFGHVVALWARRQRAQPSIKSARARGCAPIRNGRPPKRQQPDAGFNHAADGGRMLTQAHARLAPADSTPPDAAAAAGAGGESLPRPSPAAHATDPAVAAGGPTTTPPTQARLSDASSPAAPCGIGGESGPRPSPSAPAIPAAAAGDLKMPTTPAARLSDDSSPLGSSQHLSVVAGSSLGCNGLTYRGPSLTLPRRSPLQHVSTTAADDMDPICLFAAENSIQCRRPI